MSVSDERLAEMIIAAYRRGHAWCLENPGSEEYLAKAAYDYADKALSSLEASPAPVSELSDSAKDHMAEIDAAMRRGAEIGHMLVGGPAPMSEEMDRAMRDGEDCNYPDCGCCFECKSLFALAAKGGQ